MKNSQSAKVQIPGRERTIALLGDELNYYIPMNIFRVTRELAQQDNYNLLYFAGQALKSPFDFQIRSNILYNMINPQIVDGLITISNLLIPIYHLRNPTSVACNFTPPIVSLHGFEGIPV
jgi:hypothetical protein